MEMTGAIITAIICAVAFLGFVIYAIVMGQKKKLTAGAETMIGKEAIAQTVINPKGTVLAEGELWTAITKDGRIDPEEEVIITKVEGLKLWVEKRTEEKERK